MEFKDIITTIALIAGPVIAVIITLWYQRRSDKRAAGERLFTALMAHRRSMPPTAEWASALNLIDVAYYDCSIVVKHWHSLFDILMTIPLNMQRYNHQYIELLSAMSVTLGYRSIQQTDIDKFYAPQAHGDQAALNAELQKEFLRVLKATASLVVKRKSDQGHS